MSEKLVEDAIKVLTAYVELEQQKKLEHEWKRIEGIRKKAIAEWTKFNPLKCKETTYYEFRKDESDDMSGSIFKALELLTMNEESYLYEVYVSKKTLSKMKNNQYIEIFICGCEVKSVPEHLGDKIKSDNEFVLKVVQE